MVQNKLFMITGRYSNEKEATSEDEQAQKQSNQKSTGHGGYPDEKEAGSEEEQAEEQQKQRSAEYEDLVDLETSNTWQFNGSNSESVNNNQEEANLLDGFLEEPIAEYDIFGDATVETCNKDNNAQDPNSAEQLTQEDILILLENECVIAAQSCSQEVCSHHVPHIDQLFDSEDRKSVV